MNQIFFKDFFLNFGKSVTLRLYVVLTKVLCLLNTAVILMESLRRRYKKMFGT